MNESRSIGDDGSYIIQTMQAIDQVKADIAANPSFEDGYPVELHWNGEGVDPGLEAATDRLCKDLGGEYRVATNWPVYADIHWHPNTVIVIPPTSRIYDHPYFSYAQYKNGQVYRRGALLPYDSLFKQQP